LRAKAREGEKYFVPGRQLQQYAAQRPETGNRQDRKVSLAYGLVILA